MAPDKVIEALKKSYGGDADFVISTTQPGAKDPADISAVFGSSKAFQITVLFDNRLAKAKAGDTQVYRLTYALKNDSAAAHDQLKQAVVEQFTAIVAEAAGNDALTERTWVLLTEAVEGGWGLWGTAHTNAELVEAARAEIAKLQSQS